MGNSEIARMSWGRSFFLCPCNKSPTAAGGLHFGPGFGDFHIPHWHYHVRYIQIRYMVSKLEYGGVYAQTQVGQANTESQEYGRNTK